MAIKDGVKVECAECGLKVTVVVPKADRVAMWAYSILRPQAEVLHDEQAPACPRAIERQEARTEQL